MPSVTRRVLAGLVAVALLGVGTGCGDLDEASAAPLTKDDLVSEIAGQLAAGSTQSWTAKYQIAGGETATVIRAQRPSRAAYVFPGGRLITTTTVTIKCTGSTCTSTPAEAAAAAELDQAPLISPEAVQAMLAAAALDPSIVTTPHDTTIAGRHATCLTLQDVDGTPTRSFDLCVTSEGALASFTATIDGKPIDQALTSYVGETEPDAFDVPQGAKLIDGS